MQKSIRESTKKSIQSGESIRVGIRTSILGTPGGPWGPWRSLGVAKSIGDGTFDLLGGAKTIRSNTIYKVWCGRICSLGVPGGLWGSRGSQGVPGGPGVRGGPWGSLGSPGPWASLGVPGISGGCWSPWGSLGSLAVPGGRKTYRRRYF